MITKRNLVLLLLHIQANVSLKQQKKQTKKLLRNEGFVKRSKCRRVIRNASMYCGILTRHVGEILSLQL